MPHYIYESRLLKTMAGPICGVDEAGRGPLAGPVVAAATMVRVEAVVVMTAMELGASTRMAKLRWRAIGRGRYCSSAED